MSNNSINFKFLVIICSIMFFGISCSDNGTSVDESQQLNEEAILIAERFNTPDGRIMFMGVFSELPNEPIETSQLTELSPSGKAFACGGNAFFYDADASSITKFIVEDDLSLTEAQTIQLSQEGVEGFTAAHVCASSTQAFTFHRFGGRVVEWNPEEMIITEAFDVPLPEMEINANPVFFEPFKNGDLVYFPLRMENFGTNEIEPKTTVGVFDIPSKTLSFTSDDRCLSSTTGFIDSQGNFYKLHGWQIGFILYPSQENLPPPCILRINAGQKIIDPNFITGFSDDIAPAPIFPIDENNALVLTVNRDDVPETQDEFWNMFTEIPAVPTNINLETGETSRFEGVPEGLPQNSRTLTLDGDNFLQVVSFDDDGLIEKVDVMRLTSNGPEPAFTVLGGDVLTLQRLR